MSWRALVLLGLVALTAVEANTAKGSSRALLNGWTDRVYNEAYGYGSSSGSSSYGSSSSTYGSGSSSYGSSSSSSGYGSASTPCGSYNPPTTYPPTYKPSPVYQPPTKPAPAPTPMPAPTPTPAPGPVGAGNTTWMHDQCMAKGAKVGATAAQIEACFACYQARGNDGSGCVDCLGANKLNNIVNKCMTSIKGGATGWAISQQCVLATNAAEFDACAACVVGKGLNGDFSGCQMCMKEAKGDGAALAACAKCFVGGGNNFFCSQCVSISAMGPAACYACLKKNPTDNTCIKTAAGTTPKPIPAPSSPAVSTPASSPKPTPSSPASSPKPTPSTPVSPPMVPVNGTKPSTNSTAPMNGTTTTPKPSTNSTAPVNGTTTPPANATFGVAPAWAIAQFCNTTDKAAAAACVTCISNKVAKSTDNDFSGCQMCWQQAKGNVAGQTACNSCYVNGVATNFMCSQCVSVSKLGPDACYACLAKSPTDFSCVKGN